MLKIVSCSVEGSVGAGAPPGTVLALADGRSAGVATPDAVLRLGELALEGSRAMSIRDFLAGHRTFVGSRLVGKEGREGKEEM